MATPHPDLVVIASKTSASTFYAEDRNDDRFFILGTLASGVLKFDVIRKIGPDRGTITGREFFDVMMANFGAKVRVIEARWNDSDPKMTSNLDRFNRARAGGKLSVAQAALIATRTGQWADDLGFSTVSIIDIDPPAPPGQHSSVVIQFSR